MNFADDARRKHPLFDSFYIFLLAGHIIDNNPGKGIFIYLAEV
ncbi:hypothetical protein [Fodinibius sediminis]|nr:hypothetical protein [Fodinibius sediminis]